MPAQLKHGVIGASGGAREGAGRKPDWLKERCREAGPQILEFLISVATGENMEQVVTDAGETVGVPAPVKERIKAAEVVLDRGYGKAEQKIDVNDNREERPPLDVLVNTIRVLREELDAARAGTGMAAGK